MPNACVRSNSRASNSGSTEGEKTQRPADDANRIAAAQSVADDNQRRTNNVDNHAIHPHACSGERRRACSWEKSLADT